jgi:hypothetical protein
VWTRDALVRYGHADDERHPSATDSLTTRPGRAFALVLSPARKSSMSRPARVFVRPPEDEEDAESERAEGVKADEHERRFLRAESARFRRDPAVQAVRAMCEQAIGAPLVSLLAGSRLTVVILPDEDWSEPLSAALRVFARDGRPPSSLRGVEALEGVRPEAWAFVEVTGRPGCGGLAKAMAALSVGLPTVVASHDEKRVPYGLTATADAMVRVSAPSWDIVRQAAEALHGEARQWPAQPPHADAAAVTPSLLRLCLRQGQAPHEFGERLARAVGASTAKPIMPSIGPRGLARVPGLPTDVEGWSRCLARDLSLYKRGNLPWAAMDRGAVLAGPPGTGKSTLARALAEEAGVPLVTGSHAEWQGAKDGHLGSTLAAMRNTFAQARAAAPCILLIDEVDSFPNRAQVRHDYKDYMRSVVNALLQELDGPSPREGVVVLGTCNEAELLDPALTRPGRLERVLVLGPPDPDGMEAVLRVHLGGNLRDEPLADLAVMAHGMSGAEAEMAVRTAKRAARVRGAALTKGDLMLAIADARNLDLTASGSVVFH